MKRLIDVILDRLGYVYDRLIRTFQTNRDQDYLQSIEPYKLITQYEVQICLGAGVSSIHVDL